MDQFDYPSFSPFHRQFFQDSPKRCFYYSNKLLTSYLPRLFTKDMLTDPIGFLKNHLPEPEELE